MSQFQDAGDVPRHTCYDFVRPWLPLPSERLRAKALWVKGSIRNGAHVCLQREIMHLGEAFWVSDMYSSLLYVGRSMEQTVTRASCQHFYST